jgi:hypothetical protein
MNGAASRIEIFPPVMWPTRIDELGCGHKTDAAIHK